MLVALMRTVSAVYYPGMQLIDGIELVFVGIHVFLGYVEPPFRTEAGHPRESGAKGLTTTLRVSDSGNQPFLINEEVGDAGEERADHATITIQVAAAP
jgi:hypothetical protein